MIKEIDKLVKKIKKSGFNVEIHYNGLFKKWFIHIQNNIHRFTEIKENEKQVKEFLEKILDLIKEEINESN